MPNTSDPKTEPVQPVVYQIQIEGHLGPQWTDWFQGLTVTLAENGETLLSGPMVDQSALYGLLKKLRDLGLPLVSVNRLKPVPAETAEDNEAFHSHSKKE